jgi:hypothetical protein
MKSVGPGERIGIISAQPGLRSMPAEGLSIIGFKESFMSNEGVTLTKNTGIFLLRNTETNLEALFKTISEG